MRGRYPTPLNFSANVFGAVRGSSALFEIVSIGSAQVFERKGSKRRVILTTNIAETSVTVPGIGFVIDLGLARVNRLVSGQKYSVSHRGNQSSKCRPESWPLWKVGTGNLLPVVYEEVYQNKPLFPDPEIMRVNLASVLIQMRFLGLGEPQNFAFIDPPEKAALDSAQKLLIELRRLSERN